MTLQGHPRSLILAPEIYSFCKFTSKAAFSINHPIVQKFRGVPLGIDPHVVVAKSKHPRLTNREIIFEEFQPM